MNDISYNKLGAGNIAELRSLLELYVKVFGDQHLPEDTTYLNELINAEQTFFFVAQREGHILGGATAYVLPSIYGAYNELYIYDMAVETEYQHQGIGSELLTYIKTYAKGMRVQTIYVQADAEDREARNFYLKNGGIEEDVRHYDFEL